MISIIGVTVAHDLGINVRTARLRMFHALEYQHASALAHHKAVAVCIERAASRRRIGLVVNARQDVKPATASG